MGNLALPTEQNLQTGVLYLPQNNNKNRFALRELGRATMQSDFDNNLQSYFTDMEHLRGMFKGYVAAPSLTKQIIVIHGVGGSGKSSLLRMFRIHCKSEKVPVALASGDDAKSTLDVITHWMEDLKADGVKFSSLSKTMEAYQAIQAKVGDQAKKAQSAGSRMAEIASKAASKTAETAGGALLGAAIGSVVPGVGTAIGGALGGVISGMGAEALTDWLRSFLTKPDIDLLLDPEKKLTANLLADISKAAEKKRIVLLLDTYEQMTALEDWVGEVAHKIPSNVLMVVAGRKIPEWNRLWQGWMMNAQVEELKPMSEDIMRELIRRYYATMRGGEPNPVQVEAIIRFARGLPMVVTSAVQLWVKYDVEDFQSVKTEIVANLVDRLMEGVPDTLIPALEAAAVARWFDQPILRAVTGLEDVRALYNELRRFPFVRTRMEGFALHDSVREMIDENLRTQDSERYSELHERAAVYFEKLLGKAAGEEVERLGLERLYHRICADENIGIQLFQEMAQELTRYELINRLRILLNDLNNYPLNKPNSQQWREYYLLRLEMFNGVRIALADSYRKLAEHAGQPKLRAYALCDLGEILMSRETYRTTSEEAKKVLEQAIPLLPKNDSKLVTAYMSLRGYYVFRGQWDIGMEMLQKRYQLCYEINDEWGITRTLRDEGFAYGWAGDWRKAMDLHEQVRQRISLPGSSEFLKAESLFRPWYLIWSGRLKEAENGLRESIEIVNQIGHFDLGWPARRDLAFSLILQERFEDSRDLFQEVSAYFNEFGKKGELSTLLGFLGFSKAREGNLTEAKGLLEESWRIKQELEDVVGYQESLNWLGYISELDSSMNKDSLITAEEYYSQSYQNRKYGRRHFEGGALTGLIRIKHAQKDFAAIPPLLEEAEQLAQQFEHNDHLTSLRLTQAHLAWETGKKDEVIFFYQQAMIHALRYNRFLLDEVLSGRSQGTPLHPIIPYCLERGEEGRNILISLLDWWKTGINDIGKPRPDTISPIPEGTALLAAEEIVRAREPGNGLRQTSVIEQIEAALG